MENLTFLVIFRVKIQWPPICHARDHKSVFRNIRIREIRQRKNRRIPYTDTRHFDHRIRDTRNIFGYRIRIPDIPYFSKHMLRSLTLHVGIHCKKYSGYFAEIGKTLRDKSAGGERIRKYKWRRNSRNQTRYFKLKIRTSRAKQKLCSSNANSYLYCIRPQKWIQENRINFCH